MIDMGSGQDRMKMHVRCALIFVALVVVTSVITSISLNYMQHRKEQGHAKVVERCLKEAKEQTPDVIKKCNDVASAVYSK